MIVAASSCGRTFDVSIMPGHSPRIDKRQRSVVRTLRLCLVLVASLTAATDVFAQSKRSARIGQLRMPVSAALQSLDEWVVLRFRGVQLLPDSSERGSASPTQSNAPRVEATRNLTHRDTIVALQFGAEFWRPSLGVGANVQLADPAGAISNISGRITARRAFRAPRKPGARDNKQDDWRIGWAYLVTIPIRSANAAPAGFDGWSVIQSPSKSPARVKQLFP